MDVKLLLVTDPTPGAEPRELCTLDLPAVPDRAENITWADRVYRTLDRAWVVSYRDLMGEKFPVMSCALLVRQIAGPPHIMTPSLVKN